MITETITWNPIWQLLPDDDLNVLVRFERADGEVLVWPGYCDDGRWRLADGRFLVDDKVTHWAEMPEGPLHEHDQSANG